MRENALCAFVAGAGSATMAWLGLYGFAWNDYEQRGAAQPFDALVHGHLAELPAPRARLWRLAAWSARRSRWSPTCGAAANWPYTAWLRCRACWRRRALGVWLVRADARRWATGALAGGGARRVRGQPADAAPRSNSATPRSCSAARCAWPRCCWLRASVRCGPGVLLGLAIANKEWALLAAGPVLLALPSRQTCGCAACAASAATSRPCLRRSGCSTGGFAGERAWRRGAWWHDLPAVADVVVLRPSRRARARPVRRSPSPAIARRRHGPGLISHPLILAVALPLTLGAWARLRHSGGRPRRCVARTGAALARAMSRTRCSLLALLLLLRCMLDTWDNVYYPMPFLVALLAWEARSHRGDRRS